MDRILGILLFLPVPAVLALFLAAPFGVPTSLALGVALMATHRLYARPWALSAARRRCLWCGSPVLAGTGTSIEVEEPGARTAWSCCSADHEDRARRLLGWAGRHARFLGVGILGTLALFLVAAPLAHYGLLGPATHPDAAAGFRLAIALTVLPLGWLGPSAQPAPGPRVPFPVHIQALVGSVAVTWLFRLVGLWWLGAAVAHVATRVAR